MPPIQLPHYRREIDGLRGLAVAAVVLFHAGFGCPGGYVGVDMFFVLSGFLITSIICKDLENGSFSIAEFCERRARRIVPALFVVTLACFVAGSFLLLPAEFIELGLATYAQTIFAGNFYYWLSVDYFESAADEKPLLHTWSLAVEEQFYLLMPLLLMLVHRSRKHSKPRLSIILLAGIAWVSLLASCVYVHYFPSATFYLLPTRAWELLCGSLLVFAPERSAIRSSKLCGVFCEVLSWLGLMCVLVPIFCYSKSTVFPGLAAIPVCLGTVMILWANSPRANTNPTSLARLLRCSPLVGLGLISYSLYLWHWPLLAFAKSISLGDLNWPLRLALVSAAILMAFTSTQFVEAPFRRRQAAATRGRMFIFAASAGLTAVCLSLVCTHFQGFPGRFSDDRVRYANAKLDRDDFHQATARDLRESRLEKIGTNASSVQPNVLVWGDSHAMAALPALDAYLRERGLAGHAAMHTSTLPVLNWYLKTEYGLGKQSIEFGREVVKTIARDRVTDVVIIAYWRGYDLGNTARKSDFETAFLKTIDKLGELNCRVWIMLDVPAHGFNVPKALSRSYVSTEMLSQICSTPTRQLAVGPNDPQFRSKIEAQGGRVLDPKPLFLDPDGTHYEVSRNGVALYRDDHHLTVSGARMVLLPFFRDELTDLGHSQVGSQAKE